MASLISDPTTVPSIDGKVAEINPGDIWPLPYRGSRYRIRKIDASLKLCWTRYDIVHCSGSLPEGIIQAMVDHKLNSRGSLRVSPHKEAITKRQIGDGIWESVYLGKIDGVFLFDGFDLDPSKISTGNIWRGFHFKHGEQFAVWNRAGNEDYLYWTFRGLYFRTIDKYPELCAKVREIRPRCGRIYITEYGHIWMNLPINEVSDEWTSAFRELLSKDKLVLAKNDILLQSVYDRLRATKMYPIYVGHISEFDSGFAPRTHFSSGARFGIGTEDAEDGDGFTGESWKKMRRDR